MYLLNRRVHIGIVFTFYFLVLLTKNTVAKVSESLFFMGEDLDVLTIASGRPEFPENAPAIAEVINAKKMEKRGVITLSEMLSQTPGFYLEQKEWGHKLFFRGVPSGALFLYDGVPLRSDTTKSIYPIDFEMSLSPIKRIEIVRGPASVLWGPDAFVGVINLVPKSGKDLNGIEMGTTYGSPDDYKNVFLNWGKDLGTWNGFMSFSSTFIEPRKQNIKISDNNYKRLHTQKYYNFVYNFNFYKSLNISGRFSYYDKPYGMKDIGTGLNWDAKKNTPFNLIKIKWQKTINDNTLFSLKLYYNLLYQKKEELDVKWKQKNNIYYFESILNRDLFDRHGLLTLGLSYRINRVQDADIQTRTFLPDYIEHQQSHFKILIDNASFTTRLFSIFSQYRHHFNNIDIWSGIRLDYHSEYYSSITYNLGFLWRQSKNFYLKAIYGTAYRTPYATQFLDEKNVDPEEIKTFNMEFNYHKDKKLSISLIPFYNMINNHINEDPYGGYSRPNSQQIIGIEANLQIKPLENLNLFANTTFLNSWGDRETYHILDYIQITPSGEKQEHYSTWSKQYNYGTDKTGNIGISYKLSNNIDITSRINYIGKRKLIYKKDITYRFPEAITFDLTMRFKKLFDKFDAFISIKNLFDKKYEVPGTFSPIRGEGFKFYMGLKSEF